MNMSHISAGSYCLKIINKRWTVKGRTKMFEMLCQVTNNEHKSNYTQKEIGLAVTESEFVYCNYSKKIFLTSKHTRDFMKFSLSPVKIHHNPHNQGVQIKLIY